MTSFRVFENAFAGQVRKIAVTAVLVGLAAGIGRTQSAEDLRITVGKSIVIDYPASTEAPSVGTHSRARSASRSSA